jgi:putative amidoligase enzyme
MPGPRQGTCDNCDGYSRICRHCDCCSSCCECPCCGYCDAVTDRDNICDDCGRCPSCCNCDSESSFNRRNAGQGFYANFANRKHFKCLRTVGVEWEYNSIDDFKPLKKWLLDWNGGLHEDGSCGEEIVTPPLSGDYISRCIQDLGQAFAKGNAQIRDNCGLHVHVDAKDVTWPDMYKLLRVYSKIEPVLYALGGQNRLVNSYSKQCGHLWEAALRDPDPKDAILRSAYSATDGRVYKKSYNPGKKDGDRYRGLNICPWIAGRSSKNVKSDTTVEFRLHRNTSDPVRVANWAMLCARIVDWSVLSSDRDIRNLPASAARALCEVIAPDRAPWVISRLKAWRGATKRRFRRIVLNNGQYVTRQIRGE